MSAALQFVELGLDAEMQADEFGLYRGPISRLDVDVRTMTAADWAEFVIMLAEVQSNGFPMIYDVCGAPHDGGFVKGWEGEGDDFVVQLVRDSCWVHHVYLRDVTCLWLLGDPDQFRELTI